MSLDSGEMMMMKERKCIDILGGSYASQRRKEVWDFVISTTLLTWRC
jgi:hypothetical protein